MASVRNILPVWLYDSDVLQRSPSHYRRISIWVYEETDEDDVSIPQHVIYLRLTSIRRWGPGKESVHTVHVEDVAGAIWACAVWMNQQGREQAIALAGETIPFHNEKSKAKEVDGMVSPDEQPVAPLFNLVDDSETTLAKGGSMITEYFGTTFEFYSNFETTIAKVLCFCLLGDATCHIDCPLAEARGLG